MTITKWFQKSEKNYKCSTCGASFKEPTPFCPNCGAKNIIETEEKLKICKNCQYMIESRVEYDNYAVLFPECLGQKGAPRTRYNDTCPSFKQKIEEIKNT